MHRTILPRISAGWQQLKEFAYGNRQLYAALWALWLLLCVVNVLMIDGGWQKRLVYSVVVLGGELVGWCLAYGAVRLFHRGSKIGSTILMALASALMIIALGIVASCPFLWTFFSSYNHAIYLCAVEIGDRTGDTCAQIVSRRYQQQPWWQPFYRYP